MNAATEGDKAAAASDWPSAIKHYTNALLELPRAPSYYIKRSTAYSRRKAPDGGPDLQAALRDVELALVLARERGKRELIIEAQLRRAIVLFQLERYGDAGYLFDLLEEKLGIKKDDQTDVDKSAQVQAAMSQKASKKQENELSIWKIKIKGKIGKLEKGDDKLKVSILEYPGIKIPSEQELKKSLKDQLGQSTKPSESSVPDRTTESKLDVSGSSSAAPFTAGPGAPAAPAPASAPTKVRHEWYQSQDSVVLTVYVKDVDKAQLEVDLQENSVSEIICSSGFTFRAADSLSLSSLLSSLCLLAQPLRSTWIHYMLQLMPHSPKSMSYPRRSKSLFANEHQGRSGELWKARLRLPLCPILL